MDTSTSHLLPEHLAHPERKRTEGDAATRA